MSLEKVVEPPTGIYQETYLRATEPADMLELLRRSYEHNAAGIDGIIKRWERAAEQVLEKQIVHACTGRFRKREPLWADMPAIEALRRRALDRRAVTGKARDAVDILSQIMVLHRRRAAGDARGAELAAFYLGAAAERLQVRSAEPLAAAGRKQHLDGQAAGRRNRKLSDADIAKIRQEVALVRQNGSPMTITKLATRLADDYKVNPRTIWRHLSNNRRP